MLGDSDVRLALERMPRGEAAASAIFEDGKKLGADFQQGLLALLFETRLEPLVRAIRDLLMLVWVGLHGGRAPARAAADRSSGCEARGHEVLVTAREYGQTLGVLDRLGIPYEAVGSHAGASSLRQGRGALAGRSARLARLVWGRRPDLALGHGSVDLAVVSSLFRIPSVQMQDYEFAGWQRQIAFRAARRVLVPDSIPLERLRRIGAKERKLFRYPGLKEEYYLADFEPDPAVLDELGLDREKVLVVVRPPPETSEYHARNDLYGAAIRRLAGAERRRRRWSSRAPSARAPRSARRAPRT